MSAHGVSRDVDLRVVDPEGLHGVVEGLDEPLHAMKMPQVLEPALPAGLRIAESLLGNQGQIALGRRSHPGFVAGGQRDEQGLIVVIGGESSDD